MKKIYNFTVNIFLLSFAFVMALLIGFWNCGGSSDAAQSDTPTSADPKNSETLIEEESSIPKFSEPSKPVVYVSFAFDESAIDSDCPVIGDIRGRGLLMAVELVADKATKSKLPGRFQPTEKIRVHGLDNGLILYSRRTGGGKYGDWFLIAPPLTITEAECDELVSRLGATLEDFLDDLRTNG